MEQTHSNKTNRFIQKHQNCTILIQKLPPYIDTFYNYKPPKNKNKKIERIDKISIQQIIQYLTCSIQKKKPNLSSLSFFFNFNIKQKKREKKNK